MGVMVSRKRFVIIGATSAIAQHCARLWSALAAVDFVLVGRDGQKLARVADDLIVRNPAVTCTTHVVDFVDVNAIAALVDDIMQHGRVDVAFIAHGVLADQALCQSDLPSCAQALSINGLSPALFAEAFAGHLLQQGFGTLAIVGSVAGDRGRKSNYIYGAAKSLLRAYAQGLQHRFAGTAVRAVLINPGPTDTPMTAHLKQQGMRLAPVDVVAKQVVRAIDRGVLVAYVPWLWRYIMAVVCLLPASLFNRLPL